MTNGEKFVTAQERAEAFNRFCTNTTMSCNGCVFSDMHGENYNQCRFAWLDLEAKEEKPLPCPCCGADAEIHYEDDIEREGDASVQCKQCFLMTPDCASDTEAIRFWNTRVSTVSKSDNIQIGDTVAYKTMDDNREEWACFTVRAMDGKYFYENADRSGDNIAKGCCYKVNCMVKSVKESEVK